MPEMTLIPLVFAFLSVQAKFLKGTDKQCDVNGDAVVIPGITNDPCIECQCLNGRVECKRQKCGRLEGCHTVLIDRPADSCCDVCKGCTVNGVTYPSGMSWQDSSDACLKLICEAGVVTKFYEKCHVDCSRPTHLPGQCCPSCSDCLYNGMDRLDGETFPHRVQPEVLCTCKNGHVTCSYRACPVLNCPDDSVIRIRGEKCLKCKGVRQIFDIPASCFFARRVFAEGTIIRPDECTSCTCWTGTVLCDRESCPPPPCDVIDQVLIEGSCCPKCKGEKKCFFHEKTYQAGSHWLFKGCQQCHCDNGVVYCSRQTCANTLQCKEGYSLKFTPGSCCPACVKDDAVCTLTNESRLLTFDKRYFTAVGKCRYHLARDCKSNVFFVKIRTSPLSSNETWTELVTVGLPGNYTINLYRKLGVVKINRRLVTLPHVISYRFAVRLLDNNVILDASEQYGVKVIWNGNDRLELGLSKHFKSRTCGLCGNYNGVAQDDFINKLGHRVSTAEQFLESWKVRDVCQRAEGLDSAAMTTDCKPDLVAAAEKRCTALLTDREFAACASRIDVAPYIRDCIHESCRCTDDCHLRRVKSFVRRCRRAGYDVLLRRISN